jgi:hypothetical protein
MSPESSKKTSCSFNAFIQPLPSAWSLPSTLKQGKNHNTDKTLVKTQNLHPVSILSIMGKLFEKLIIRIHKHNEERNLLNAGRSQYNTSMYEAGGSRHPKFQQ